MTNSRNKGSAFERAIAADLHLLTGITFKRDLEQYRATDHGDLIPSDDAWPFVVECKRYAAGAGCRPAWLQQATKSADAVGKLPCVIFKYDRLPIRCAVPFSAIAAAFGGTAGADEWAETTLDGLAYLAREIMASKEQVPGSG